MSVNTLTSAVRGPAEHEVRDQILAAATEHFRQYGYAKTTVSELAKSIGFSKAYIYKFFASKQDIGDAVCALCLQGIETEVRLAADGIQSPPERFRVMFKAFVAASSALFFSERKLYDIASTAVLETWPSTLNHQERIHRLVREIVQLGRERGDFESQSNFDETVHSIVLVMRSYLNPLLLQFNLDALDENTHCITDLVLRSLAP